MASPAELPHADEALKALVVRFREAPGSSACAELASALLARGHAAEALRIAEHGLQLIPNNVDGRIERARALLAMGRPRVAYVELRRALAIDQSHRRARRLLGQAFRDAGAPHRAAQLLANRSIDGDDANEATKPAIPVARQRPPPSKTERIQRPAKEKLAPPSEPAEPAEDPKNAWDVRPKGGGAIPADLFQDLTRDLGLSSGAVPDGQLRRVEVTQIIRRKGLPRPPRSASELVEIDGPIVDTTQPGQIVETQQIDPAPSTSPKEPAPLFPSEVDPVALGGFALDDEPLFEENMPFQVRPVEADANELASTLDAPAHASPTVPVGPPGMMGPGGPPAWASEAKTTQARPELPPGLKSSSDVIGQSADTVVDHVEEQGAIEELPSTAEPPPKLIPEPEPQNSQATSDKVRFEGAPIVDRGITKKKQTPRLEIASPKRNSTHIAFAFGGLLILALYMAGLFWFSMDEMQVWLPTNTTEPPPKVLGSK